MPFLGDQGLRRGPRRFVVVFLVIAAARVAAMYGMMTGMSLATMRAIWMMVIFLVAQMFGKSYDMPTAMGIALFFMLLCNPVRILDAGLQ